MHLEFEMTRREDGVKVILDGEEKLRWLLKSQHYDI